MRIKPDMLLSFYLFLFLFFSSKRVDMDKTSKQQQQTNKIKCELGWNGKHRKKSIANGMCKIYATDSHTHIYINCIRFDFELGYNNVWQMAKRYTMNEVDEKATTE